MLKKIKFISNVNSLYLIINNSIQLYSINTPQSLRLNYQKWYKFFIYKSLAFSFNWLRLTWRGKTYIVYFFKKKQIYSFRFGFSHWSKLRYTLNYNSFKFNRQSYFFYCIGYKSYKILRNYIKSIKLINKYTKRGLRVKKQSFVRRFGKISQANSIFSKY